jgi:hypothetical protein
MNSDQKQTQFTFTVTVTLSEAKTLRDVRAHVASSIRQYLHPGWSSRKLVTALTIKEGKSD